MIVIIIGNISHTYIAGRAHNSSATREFEMETLYITISNVSGSLEVLRWCENYMHLYLIVENVASD